MNIVLCSLSKDPFVVVIENHDNSEIHVQLGSVGCEAQVVPPGTTCQVKAFGYMKIVEAKGKGTP